MPKDNYEIILVDGLSDDNTLKIVKETTKNFKNIKILTNENKVTPFAMNIGIKNASGNVIVIVGGHATFPENFLLEGLELFNKYPDASCVGGPITSIGENDFAKATSLAMSSRVGIGNASHRFPDYEGPAEMACFPFYKKEVFDEIGLFDERFVRNQDDELAFRLTRSGRKIYISPKVISNYIVRSSPKKLFKQYCDYGYYKWLGCKKHKRLISIRHIIPTLFLFFNMTNIMLSLYLNNIFIFIIPLFLYLFVIFMFSLKYQKKGIKIVLSFNVAVIILHFSYGYGFLKSFLLHRKF